ncbi:MAG: phytoene desaturase [Pseudomonadota bacterium]
MKDLASTNGTAAVIGSGFGGLALAIRLQSAGIATTIFEARDKPGGRAYVYEDKGFTFDAGPTVITDPACLEQLWALSGRRMADDVELMPVSPFYRLCWEDGTVFDYDADQGSIDAQIQALNPADVEGYRKLLAYSEDLYQEGYVRLGTVPFLNLWSMAKVLPTLVRLQSHKSVYTRVSEFIKNEKLRQAFSFHTLLLGGNPFSSSAIYSLIHALERKGKVWFVRGGTGALVRAMANLFEELGGRIMLSSPVEQILTEGERATGVRAKGEVYAFDSVASNADVMHTYKSLLSSSKRGPTKAKALKKSSYSMSLFVVYFGLSRKHPQLKHHMVLFGARYRELLADIFGANTLADDFSLYLHAPCASDPSMAPEGSSAYYVLSPVPHLGTADIDWDEVGPLYRDRILRYLEERYIPGLREDLVTVRHFSPFDFRDQLNAHLGSAFSVEPILTQSAWFRPHNRDDVISNLYLVGAGTHPGAGIPGVVGSAKATAGLMLESQLA